MQLSVPKSDSSNRIALVLPVYIDLIKEHKQYRTGLFVFGKKDGSPNDPRKIEDSFSRFLRRIGIINVSFHTLRHTFATHSMKCRAEAKGISEMLEHSIKNITLNYYQHL